MVNCLLVVHKYRSSERSPGGGLGGLGSLDDETEVIRPLDPFELQFCREDRERVQDILNLDPSGPRNRMLEYFYKALLRPVQTGCKKIRRVGKSKEKKEYFLTGQHLAKKNVADRKLFLHF